MKSLTSIKKKRPKERTIYLFLCVACLIWQMFIYRKTMVPLWVPLTLFVGGGTAVFLLRGRVRLFNTTNEVPAVQLLVDLFMAGSLAVFLPMAGNYYFAENHRELYTLPVLKADHMHAKGSDTPYVIVDFKGMRKQVVLPSGTEVTSMHTVTLRISKGLLGFYVIREDLFN